MFLFPPDHCHDKDYKKAYSNPRAQKMKQLLKWKWEHGLHWSISFSCSVERSTLY